MEWVATAGDAEAVAFCERVRRAATAVAAGPLADVATDLGAALRGAAALFDAGLYFEVHELLEPHWIAEQGSDRGILQGLIQIAVGYQHLANGNVKGARALLDEGSGKIQARSIQGLDLQRFALGVRTTLASVGTDASFDWAQVPPFPRQGA
jgi:hypothetical protein